MVLFDLLVYFALAILLIAWVIITRIIEWAAGRVW